MKRFKNLKIATKQIIGFGFILVTMTAGNIQSILKMESIKTELDDITTNWMPRALAIADMNQATSDLRLSQLQHTLAPSDTLVEKLMGLIDRIETSKERYDSLFTRAQTRRYFSEKERELYDVFSDYWDNYQDLSLQFFRYSLAGESQKAVALLNGKMQIDYNSFTRSLEDLVGVIKRDSAAAARRADRTLQSARKISRTFFFSTIILAIILTYLLIRYISVPVEKLAVAAEHVAEGHLDIQLSVASNDEIGKLSHSFNRMTSSLSRAEQKTRQQAERLKRQKHDLEQMNIDLGEKSEILSQKNIDLETALKELRSTQEQLLMKEKMASLGNLVAGIAHEINNPVGSLKSAIDVSGRCIKRIETILTDSNDLEALRNGGQFPKAMKMLKDNIHVTLVAGERIATIVRSLKNFAQLDEAEFQLADIHEGIESSLNLLGSEIRRKILIRKQYGNIPDIWCFPGQLNQVFINLLTNAAQAIEGPGEIEIKTYEKQHNIFIEISDNGRGIPRKRLQNIFDFNFSDDGKRIKMGSGLSSAYNIIQNHDGEIVIESEVNQGTRVSLKLPIKTKDGKSVAD